MKNIDGTSLDFGARIYDTRIGRLLSIDPETKRYPMTNPYCGIGDNKPLTIVF